jgi:DNA topoisomerase-3
MENAGQLIEDEELRAHIKGSGIGTSATRAEILKKLFNISYLNLNKKTQTITPTLKGELVYGIVGLSIPAMLNPTLTASWEKGLSRVEEGNVTEEEYMGKLEHYVRSCVSKGKDSGKQRENSYKLGQYFRSIAPFYKK